MKGYQTQRDKDYWYGYWRSQINEGLVLLRRSHPVGFATSFVKKNRAGIRKVETRLFGGERFEVFEEE